MDEQELNIAWINLARVYGSVRIELDRALETETGTGLSESEVLYRLVFAPSGRLRMTDLADRLCMAQSGITRLVDRLVTRGWVVREPRPDNRRTVDARLTDSGRAAFEQVRPVYMRCIGDGFGRELDTAQTTELRAMLRRILGGMGVAEEVPWASVLGSGGTSEPAESSAE